MASEALEGRLCDNPRMTAPLMNNTYYVLVGERTIGPVDQVQVVEAIRQGKVSRHASIRMQEDQGWRPIDEVEPFVSEFSRSARKPATSRWFIGGFVLVAGFSCATGAILSSLYRLMSSADSVQEPTRVVAAPSLRREVSELIVGTWLHEALPDEVYQADGTLRIGQDAPARYSIEGTAESATLTIVNASGVVRTWRVSFPDDDTMQQNSLVYRRGISGTQSWPHDASELIVGSWRSGRFAETYSRGGLYTINDAVGAYEVSGDSSQAVLQTRVGARAMTWIVSFPTTDTMRVVPASRPEAAGLLYVRVAQP